MSARNILVINCGSSSIKFALVNEAQETFILSGLAERLGSPEAVLHWRLGEHKDSLALPGADHRQALSHLLPIVQQAAAGALHGIGHRVVHGGEHFSGASRLDASSLHSIRQIAPLAPLHNPANLQGIEAAMKLFPDLIQVAVFDTAFHQTLPERAYLYALPQALYRDHGVRRYGFHGTSHRFVAEEANRRLDLTGSGSRILTAHLGSGCSTCAVLGGQSVDTSMGLTPLEGLVMGTRSGDVDPGLHAYLADRLGLDLPSIQDLLNKESGLLGLSGLSDDMRELERAAEQGHTHAQLALEIFAYRLARQIASLLVPLGGLDALVFTGGIGENSSPTRTRTVELLAHLGLALDEERNAEHGRRSQGRISGDASPAILVIPTDEEFLIAQDTASRLAK